MSTFVGNVSFSYNPTTPTNTNGWRSVAYGNVNGNGIYVAVSIGNTFITSPDGVTWTSRINNFSNTYSWNKIIFANVQMTGKPLFVAVTNNNNIIINSEDGINWNLVNVTSLMYSAGIQSITYGTVTNTGEGVFLASASYRILKSNDGNTWTRASTSGNIYVTAYTGITYGITTNNNQGMFVAVASNYNRLIYSRDTVNWNSVITSDLNVNNGCRTVNYGIVKSTNTSLFIAAKNSNVQDNINISTDGERWTRYNLPNVFSSIAYGNGMFVLPSYNNTGVFYYTLDGLKWSNTASLGASIPWNDITYSNDQNKFVAVNLYGGSARSANGTYNTTGNSIIVANFKWTSYLDFPSSFTRTYLDPSFSIISNIITNNTESPTYSYSSNFPLIANIVNGIVTIGNPGTASISITQSTTTNYTAVTATTTIIVNKITSSLTFPSSFTRNFLDPSFSIISNISTNNPEGPTYSYSSNFPLIANIVNDIVTIGNAGTANIRLTQSETTNYTAVTANTSITVNKLSSNLTFPASFTRNFLDPSFSIISNISTNNPEGPTYSYNSDLPLIANIVNGIVIIGNAGIANIVLTQSETTNYTTVTANTTITVNKIPSSLTFPSSFTRNFLDPSFSIIPNISTNNTDGPTYSYSSAAPLIANIVDGIVTVGNAGTANIILTQSETTNYVSVTANTTITVNKIPSSLAFPTSFTRTFRDPSFSIISNILTNNTDTPTYSYSSNFPLIANIVDGIVTIGNAGIANIILTQSETTNYTAVIANTTITVNKAIPTLSIPNFTRTYNEVSFYILPNISTNNPERPTYSYSSDLPLIANIVNGTVTTGNAGIANITINQLATTNYTSVTANTTITVNPSPPYNLTFTYNNNPNNSWRGIDYGNVNGNGLFVAVGTGNLIITSSDGINWTSKYNNFSNAYNWKTIVYADVQIINKKLFVAVSNNSNIVINSEDGVNWNTIKLDYSVLPTGLNGLTYGEVTSTGNSVFVGAGPAGLIKSTDGNTWTKIVHSNISSSLYDIKYGVNTNTNQGIFVAVANTPKIIYSTDTINWTSINLSGNVASYISYGLNTLTNTGLFITSHPTFNNSYNISSDGINWSNFYLPNSSRKIGYGNGLFILTKQYFNYSRDGVTWQNANNSLTGDWETIAYGNGKYVAVGVGNTAVGIYTEYGITVDSSFTSVYGSSLFNLNAITNYNDSLIKYTSVNPLIANVDSYGNITIGNVGNTQIQLSQSQNNYTTVTANTTITVNKATPTITIPNFSRTYNDPSFSIISNISTNNPEGPTYSYNSDLPLIANIVNGIVIIGNAGTANIILTGSATTNYNSTTANILVTVNKILANITVNPNFTTYYGFSSFPLNASTTNTDSSIIDYTTDNPTVATVNINGNVIIGNVGVANILLSQNTQNYTTISANTTITVLPSYYTIDWRYQTALSPFLNTYNINCATYGNGIYVINRFNGSTTNILLTSKNLITWTSNSISALNSIKCITYGNNLFVALRNSSLPSGDTQIYYSNSQGIFTSTNVTTINDIINVDSIVYGNNLFVAVASSVQANQVITSIDGRNWNKRVAPASNWNGIAYGNGVYVAVAPGNVMTSQNGISWTLQANIPYSTWDGIAYGNVNQSGLFVAIAPGNVMTSQNGISWTLQANIPNNNWTSITYGGNTFVAVANSTASTNNQTITSNDGITWNIGGLHPGRSWNAVIYGNNEFVTFGSGNTMMVGTPKYKIISNTTINPEFNINYRDASFNIRSNITINNTENPIIQYVTGNAIVANVVGDMLIIGNAGNTNISINQYETSNYGAVTTSTSIVVNKLQPILNYESSSYEKKHKDQSFNLRANTTNTDSNRIRYSTDNQLVAVVTSNGNVIIGNAGTANITLTGNASNNYNVVTANILITVSKIEANIRFPNSSYIKNYLDASFNLRANTTNTDSTQILYSTDNPFVAVVNTTGNVFIGNVGTANILLTGNATTNYFSTTANISITVNKINANLNYPAYSNLTKNYLDPSFPLNANTTNRDSTEILYSTDNTRVAIVDINGNVTIGNAGTANITLIGDATTNYNSVTANILITVNKIQATLGFPDSSYTKNYLDPSFNLNANTTNTDSTQILYSTDNTEVAIVDVNGDVIIGNAGTANISLIGNATDNYNSVTANILVTVNKIQANLEYPFPSYAKNYLDPFFELNANTTNMDSTQILYSTDNTQVATVNSFGNVFIGNAGTANITLTGNASTNYNSVTANILITVNPIQANLEYPFSSYTKNYKDVSFALNANTTNTDSTQILYSTDNPEVAIADINGNVVIGNAGIANITLTGNATINYNSVTANILINVNKIQANLGYPYSSYTKNYLDESFPLDANTTNTDSTQILYSTDNTQVAIVDITGNVVIGNAGTANIRLFGNATTNYFPASANILITVNPIQANITAPSSFTRLYGNTTPFNITASTNNPETPIQYTSINPFVATVDSNGNVIIGNAGNARIQLYQPNTLNYTAITANTTIFVNKITPSLIIDSSFTRFYKDASFSIVPNISTTNTDTPLPAIIYISTNPNVANVVSDIVTIGNVGNTIITLTQPSTTNFESVTANTVIRVNKIQANISYISVFNKNYKDPAFSLNANTTNTDSNQIVYSSDNLSVATVNISGFVTVQNVGTANILLQSLETSNFLQAISANTTINVSKITPNINNYTPVYNKTYNDAPFNLNTTSTNTDNSEIYYSSDNLNVASVNTSGIVTVGNSGTANITITGNASINYYAISANTTIYVNKLQSVINARPSISQVYGTVDVFNIGATTNNIEANITYNSLNPSIVTVDTFGNVTIVSIGNTIIQTNQPETSNFLSTTANTIINITTIPGNWSITYANQLFVAINSTSNLIMMSSDGINWIMQTSPVNNYWQDITFGNGQFVSISNYGENRIITTNVPKLQAIINVNQTTFNATYNDAPFQIIANTTNTDSTVIQYTSENTNIATVNQSGRVTIVTAGNTTVTLYQPETVYYLSATATVNININKFQPYLVIANSFNNIYQDASFNWLSYISTNNTDSTRTIQYSSTNPIVANVVDDIVTIGNVGNTTITLTQLESTNFLSVTANTVIRVNKKEPVLNYTSSYQKTYRDPSFMLDANTTNTDSSQILYSTDNTAVAIVNSIGNVTIGNVGTANIRLTGNETANYLPISANITVNVQKLQATLQYPFSSYTKNYLDASFALNANTTNIDNTQILYTTNNASVADVNASGNVFIGNAGTATITLTGNETANYLPISANILVTILKIFPNLNVNSNFNKIYKDANFNLNANTSNTDNISIQYRSDNINVAVVSASGNVTIGNTGTANILLTRAETANYFAVFANTIVNVTNKQNNLYVSPSFTTVYGNTGFMLDARTDNTETDIQYSSDSPNVANVVAGNVTVLGAGNANITVSQSATTNYDYASINTMIHVLRNSAQITVDSSFNATYNDAPFNLNANTTNTDTSVIQYQSSNPTVANVVAGIVIVGNAGSTLITLSQPETANFLQVSANTVITVNPYPATLTFPTAFTQTYLDASFSILPDIVTNNQDPYETRIVTYRSDNTIVANIVAGNLIIGNAGTANITLTQPATLNYTTVSANTTITVNPYTPTLSIPHFTQTYLDASFSILPNISTDNQDPYDSRIVTYSSDNTVVANIIAGVLIIGNAGTAQITLTQPATLNYTSVSATTIITVNKYSPNLTVSNFTQTHLDASFSILPNISTNNEDPYNTRIVTYRSDNTRVAFVVATGNLVIGNVGYANITLTQRETLNYTSVIANSIVQVTPFQPNLSIPNYTQTYLDQPFSILPDITTNNRDPNNTRILTYNSNNAVVANIVDGTLTIGNAGTANIQITQSATLNYKSVSANTTVTVNKYPAELTIPNYTQTYLDASFSILPDIVTNNQDPYETRILTYSSDNTTIANIVDGNLIIGNVGTANITLTQSATLNYTSVSANTIITVNRSTPTLSIPNFTQTYLDASFSILPNISTNNEDPYETRIITYSSNNPIVANIIAGILIIGNAGTAQIRLSQPATQNYASVSANTIITVNKYSPNLTVSNFTQTHLDASFSILPNISTNNQDPYEITYSSDNTRVAFVVAGNLVVGNVGNANITLTQQPTLNYTSVTARSLVQVTPFQPNLSIPNFTQTYLDQPFSILPNITTNNRDPNNTRILTYNSDNVEVASIIDGTLTIGNAGSANIRVTQSATLNYKSVSANTFVTVNKYPAELTIPNYTQTYLDASFSILPDIVTNNQDPYETRIVTYSSDNSGIANIVAGNLIIGNAGTANVTLTQPETLNYTSVSANTFILVNQATATLSIPPFYKTHLDASLSIIPNISTNNKDIPGPTYTYQNYNSVVANIVAGNLIIGNAGNANITITQSSTLNYKQVSANIFVRVSKFIPNLILPPSFTQTYLDASYSILPNISTNNKDPGRVLTYSSNRTTVATIVAGNLIIRNAGTANITITQRETLNYTSVITRTIIYVNKFQPNLIIPDFTQTYLDNSFSITPYITTTTNTDSPGPKYTYQSNTPVVANIVSGNLFIGNAGSANIRITLSSTANYNSVTANIVVTVNPFQPNLTVPNFTKTYLDPSSSILSQIVTNNKDPNNTRIVTYSSDNSIVANIVAGILTVGNAGTANVQLTQPATLNYKSVSANTIVTVNKYSPNLIVPNFTQTYLDLSFSILPNITTNNQDPYDTRIVTYSSNNPVVANIIEGNLIIGNAGTANIQLTQPETLNYASVSANTVITVNKYSANLTVPSSFTQTYLDASFSILPNIITNNEDPYSTRIVTYSSDNTGVADIITGNLIIGNVGTANIRFTQPATLNYTSASANTVVNVNKFKPSLIIPDFTQIYLDQPFSILPSIVTNNLDVPGPSYTYQTDNSVVADIVNNQLIIGNVGNTTITVTQSSTLNYTTVSANIIVTVNPLQPNLTIPHFTQTYLDVSFSIIPNIITNNQDPYETRIVTYSSDNLIVANIVDGNLIIGNAGTANITLTQPATLNYTSVTANTVITVNPAIPSLSIPNFTKTYLDASFSILPDISTDNQDPYDTRIITYSSNNPVVADIVAGILIIGNAGTTNITLTQPATLNYTSVIANTIVIVNKLQAQLNYTPSYNKTYKDDAFPLNANTTNTDNNQIDYFSNNLVVANVDNSGIVTIGNVGTANISLSGVETPNYLPVFANVVISVEKLSPTITVDTSFTRIYQDAPFNINASTTNSEIDISYTSLNTDVATMDRFGILSIGNVGNAIIQLRQAETLNYSAVIANTIVFVTKKSPIISVDGSFTRIYQDASFNINASTTNSETDISYISLNTDVATVNQFGIITIGNVGNAIIQLYQPDTSNYSTITANTIIYVTRKQSTISVDTAFNRTYQDNSFQLGASSINPEIDIQYSSSNPIVANVVADIATIGNAGTATITLFQPDTYNYLSTSTTTTINVFRKQPALTVVSTFNKIYQDEPFLLNSTTTNPETQIEYSSSNPIVANAISDIVTVGNVGNTTITLHQPATTNYLSITATTTINVGRSQPYITVRSFFNGVFQDPPFLLNSITTNLETPLQYTSSNPTVATVVNDIATIGNVGSSVITLFQPSTLNYNSVSIDTYINVFPKISSISVDNSFNVIYGSNSFNLNAISNNTESAIVYNSSNPRVARVSSGGLIIVGNVGNATISLYQPSSSNFLQTNTSTIIYVSLKSPIILVDPVFNTTYGGNSFVLNESSTNTETPIQYISNDPNIVSILNGNTVVVGNVGTTTITLFQPESLNFASTTATTIVNVNKITAIITVNPVYNVIYGNIKSFYLNATSNNRDIPITYVSTQPDVADVVSDLVTVNNIGTTSILLSQENTQNYTSAFSETTVNVTEKFVPPPKKNFVTSGNNPTRNTAIRYSEIINNIEQQYKTWNYKKK